MRRGSNGALYGLEAQLDALPLPEWREWLWAIGEIAAAAAVGLLVHWLVFTLLLRGAKRAGVEVTREVIRRLRRPLRLTFPLLAIQVVMPAVALPEGQKQLIHHLVSLALVASVVWLAVAVCSIVEHLIKSRHRIDVADNLGARRVHTQITVLTRTVMAFVVIIGIGAGLMTLPAVRELGAGLLASAGVAGLVIGLAARPVLENLIAGVQLALTQPVRLDDVVIVDGEWGRIEQITTTYVVVRIWDERRLIVPFSKFITEAFQNWTRESADILGTVFLFADYTVPVQAVREELERIVKQASQWDGKVCVLQVTDATERTMQLRALVSAASSGAAWDLRVFVREKLIEFLQREYPGSLPRTRVELPERVHQLARQS